MSRHLYSILLVATLLLGGTPAWAARITLVDIDGPIGPAMAAHLADGVARAAETGADALVLRIDTPGGLDSAMRDMIKAILGAPLPVLCHVGPPGARAASAGTYILYSCHVASMAPATNLGAATPIPIGGVPTPPRLPGGGEAEDGETPEAAREPAAPPADAAGRKAVEDAVAYIRALAEQRGRNADWAELAVREGASLSAGDALAQGVIDLMAEDVDDLLAQVDGREITVGGVARTLDTAAARIERVEPDWRTELLSIITNPTVAYMLLLAGIYGLLLEGYNPGALLPGVVGAICLLLALYALQVLPVNYAGLALILLGLVLLVAEAMAPSFGVLGFGGVVAFVVGSIILFDADVPGFGINLMVVAGLAASAALLMGLTVQLFMRARRSAVVTGEEALAGARVQVLEFGGGAGWGIVAGEHWQLRSRDELAAGDQARVSAVDGLVLEVRRDQSGAPTGIEHTER